MEEIQSIKKEEYVQVKIQPLLSCLIMDAEEIILLKHINKVLINKFINHPMHYQNSLDVEEVVGEGLDRYYNELLSYNKLYLSYRNGNGVQFFQSYFGKDGNSSYEMHKTLPIFHEEPTTTCIMSREEVEKYFNPLEYDGMYIMDINGIISYAYNKKDGIVINSDIIPSDEKIIIADKEKRKFDNKERCILKVNYDNWNQTFEPKSIKDIKNIKIWGGALNGYTDFLVTVKDGKFDVKWFRLKFLEQDKFQLDISPIYVSEPNQEDILEHDQHYPFEPDTKRILVNK